MTCKSHMLAEDIHKKLMQDWKQANPNADLFTRTESHDSASLAACTKTEYSKDSAGGTPNLQSSVSHFQQNPISSTLYLILISGAIKTLSCTHNSHLYNIYLVLTTKNGECFTCKRPKESRILVQPCCSWLALFLVWKSWVSPLE